ncbi:hypothetical protein SAMN02745866_01572 [Alteromonadaceae bacterium Bs31]|nr:hypothetical protein SAMN02745866_01572 [Alteromonadaceae bacterium Bs31]
MKKYVLLLVFMVCASKAWSLEVIVGKVTLIEATYLPQLITFTLDSGSENCPAGAWIRWEKESTENNLAVYSTLLAALLSGNKVRAHIEAGDTKCMVQYIHLLKS